MVLLMRCRKKVAEREAFPSRRSHQEGPMAGRGLSAMAMRRRQSAGPAAPRMVLGEEGHAFVVQA